MKISFAENSTVVVTKKNRNSTECTLNTSKMDAEVEYLYLLLQVLYVKKTVFETVKNECSDRNNLGLICIPSSLNSFYSYNHCSMHVQSNLQIKASPE